jgi:hypothetical protein
MTTKGQGQGQGQGQRQQQIRFGDDNKKDKIVVWRSWMGGASMDPWIHGG